MRVYLLLGVCLGSTALAYGQQTYTNADLARFQVPGAFTNEDLKRLEPLAVQRQPAVLTPPYVPKQAPVEYYQASYYSLQSSRRSLQAELAYEIAAVDFSESAFADPVGLVPVIPGDTRSFAPRLGYRVQAKWLIQELNKRIALLDAQIEALVDAARREGAAIDLR
jgi:hypothetical protein